jgi:hypothetical protein
MQQGCHEGQATPPPSAFSMTFYVSSVPSNRHAVYHAATAPDRRGLRRRTPESSRAMLPGGRTMPKP